MTYPASSIGWKQGFNKKAIQKSQGTDLHLKGFLKPH